jgi:putative DNA primase/helicase
MSRLTDHNDLQAVRGLEVVAAQVAAAVLPQVLDNTRVVPSVQADFPESTVAPPARQDHRRDPLAPPVLPRSALPGLLAEIVDAACANSEAHPAAVAANIICLFCCAVGRAAFQRIGDSLVHARVFALIVGKSGKARKGTAEHLPREIFKRVDAILRKRHSNDLRQRVHGGGLSSGEGIGFAIRDPREPDEKGKGGDVGVIDKRLMVIESEFSNVLAQVKREGNILSATIRNLWDGRDIEPLTKTSQMTATKPHVVIIGHITGHELREKSTENDAANGLLNRFMLLHVHRPKLVPLPEPTPTAVVDALAVRLAHAIDKATGGNPLDNNTVVVAMTLEAREVWCELYPGITQDREGLAGSLMARSEVYARMLAMVFALLDCRTEIEPCDLYCALDWVNYWHQSIEYVFLTEEADTELDPFTTEVLEVVRKRPGVKLSEIQQVWSRKRLDDVHAALESLLNLAPPLIEMRRDQSKGGRPAHRYYLVGA